MKPKELANLYVNKVNEFALESIEDKSRAGQYNSKQIALIIIDEVLNAVKGMVDDENGYSSYEYYLEVKQEIIKI